MKKAFLLFYFLIGLNFAYAQSDILVLYHDTTIVASQPKRLADRDTLMGAVNSLLSSYNVATFNTAAVLSGLGQYKSIIIQETSFDALDTRYLGAASRDSLKAWLSGGTIANKRTLIFIGADQAYNYSRTGSAAQDLMLAATLLKFNYRMDNGNVTANNTITGVAIDVGNTRGYTTSPVGAGFWPDGVEPLSGASVLYHYTGRGTTDTVAAVAALDTNYIGISFFLDPRYFTNGDFYHALNEMMIFAMANGGQFPGYIPVELVSFTATTISNNVKLSWSTASEINNQGFEIERSDVNGEWQTIGFVPGYGTVSEMKYYSYTDAGLNNGSYLYRLKQIDYNGTFEYSPVVEAEVNVPTEFVLNQNFPNPFNPSTRISFGLAVDSKVSLKIHNVLGQEVVTLLDNNITAGNHDVNFDASSLTSGVYFYTIEAKGVDGSTFMNTKKMILTK